MLALALVMAIVATGAVAATVGAAVDARHRAAAAADAAALAAATHVDEGPDPACELAGRVARADGAALLACTFAGPVATVSVAATTRMTLFGEPLLGTDTTARLNARAGPAETNRDKAVPLVRPS